MKTLERSKRIYFVTAVRSESIYLVDCGSLETEIEPVFKLSKGNVIFILHLDKKNPCLKGHPDVS